MNCQRCTIPVPTIAPFCPVCGADPVVGADWLATSSLLLDSQGEVVLPHLDRPEAASMFELETELLYHATGIAAAEAASADALLRWQEACAAETARDVAARGVLEKVFNRETREALARLSACRAPFRRVAELICDSVVRDEPPAEVFARCYSPALWALREYAAYLDELSTAELRDVLRRRSRALLSRRGFVDEASFTAADASFALTYDHLALHPLPADDHDAVQWLCDNFGGHEGSFGELALALVPAAWRGWLDQDLAPWAGLVVFVKPDPLAGIACDDPDWEGERAGACAHYAAWLNEPGEKVEDVRPATICGLPAVRCQLTVCGEQGEEYLVDHAWVRGAQHLYYVFAWAPDQRHELVRAVHGAFAGFAPAGCATARDAAPGSIKGVAGADMEPFRLPADVGGRGTAEEDR